MKNYNTWLCTILLCIGGASLFAQTFSIKAGINRANLSNFRGDQYSSLIKTAPGISFHLQTSIELPLSETYSVEGGLKYNGIGHEYQYNFSREFVSWEKSVSFQSYYLNFPLRFNFNYHKEACEAYLFAGAYLGMGLHGKEDQTRLFSNGMKETSQIPVFGEEGYFNRLDYGALAGGGVYFGSVFLELSYSLGLANVYAGRFSPERVKNRWVSLSLGCRL